VLLLLLLLSLLLLFLLYSLASLRTNPYFTSLTPFYPPKLSPPPPLLLCPSCDVTTANSQCQVYEIELEFLGKDSMLFKQTIDFKSYGPNGIKVRTSYCVARLLASITLPLQAMLTYLSFRICLIDVLMFHPSIHPSIHPCEQVFENLRDFVRGKKPQEDVFDSLTVGGDGTASVISTAGCCPKGWCFCSCLFVLPFLSFAFSPFYYWLACLFLQPLILNAHLSSLMPGLSAKVFRTYNASETLQNELPKTEDLAGMTVQDKVSSSGSSVVVVVVVVVGGGGGGGKRRVVEEVTVNYILKHGYGGIGNVVMGNEEWVGRRRC